MADHKLRKDDALLLIDLQRDFFHDGPLEIPGAESVVQVLNEWIVAAREGGALVVATRDWHTVDHVSFRTRGGPWPPHCVQDSPGSFFHQALRLPASVIVVSKGTSFDIDQQSAFDGTGLEHFLRRRGVTRLWVGGLAEDGSVRETVEDACRLGFETHLIANATRPFEKTREAEVLRAMNSAGAYIEYRA